MKRVLSILLLAALLLTACGTPAIEEIQTQPTVLATEPEVTVTEEAPEPTIPEPQPEELTEEEREDLVDTVEKLAPVDLLGKSFTSEELTDTELLQVAYGIYGGRNSGFASMGSEWFTDKVAARYFGRTEVALADIPCSCGELLAVYVPEEDIFDWDGSNAHDNTAHASEALNLYQEAYRLDGEYIITMYKLFPDLKENITSDTIGFYATYTDAKNQNSPLFTAAGEEEMTARLEELDPAQLTLHTYRFAMGEDGYYKLTEYTIG